VKFKLPKLNQKQIEKLSDVVSDSAIVSLASIAFPAILDRLDVRRLILGGILTLALWIISIWLRR